MPSNVIHMLSALLSLPVKTTVTIPSTTTTTTKGQVRTQKVISCDRTNDECSSYEPLTSSLYDPPSHLHRRMCVSDVLHLLVPATELGMTVSVGITVNSRCRWRTFGDSRCDGSPTCQVRWDEWGWLLHYPYTHSSPLDEWGWLIHYLEPVGCYFKYNTSSGVAN